jgi:hypothetical protein
MGKIRKIAGILICNFMMVLLINGCSEEFMTQSDLDRDYVVSKKDKTVRNLDQALVVGEDSKYPQSGSGTAYYWPNKSTYRGTGFNLQNGEAAMKPMKDLTYSGVCFEVDGIMTVGDLIEMRIILPGEESITLKGNIIWSEMNASSKIVYTAVQFLPFGTDERYNSMEIYQKLKKIVSAYECLIKTG